MIQITGLDVSQIDKSMLTQLEKSVLQKKQESNVIYRYDSLKALLFELKMRTNIVESAKALYASHVGFATFRNSRANEQFWIRTEEGGFQQKLGVLASDAINDIFEHGRFYAFECATAMVIILYKATLDSIGKDTFNAYFRDLLLRGWNYDSNLRIITVMDRNEAYSGDVVYFKNPDFNPVTPQWQGENAIILADNLYYGHGIGFRNETGMIADLNTRRRPGSTISAYLTEQKEHPDFNYIYNLQKPISARIGTRSYLLI